MTTQAITPFGRYVRLYTLHQIERPLVLTAAAQDDALTRGLDRPFVRGYLAGQGGDPAHDAVFGASDTM